MTCPLTGQERRILRDTDSCNARDQSVSRSKLTGQYTREESGGSSANTG